MARAIAALLVAAIAVTLVVFVRGLHAERRAPPSLPTPRRALARAARRADLARRRPDPGRLSVRIPDSRTGATDPAPSRPEVIAFLDPSVTGAVASLDRHADAIAEVAATGLLLGDGGAVVDRLDEHVIAKGRAHHLRVTALVQDLDERDGRWRGDRVAALLRDGAARRRFVDSIERACEAHALDGVQLDFEELSDADWRALPALVSMVAARLHARGGTLAVDVPAEI